MPTPQLPPEDGAAHAGGMEAVDQSRHLREGMLQHFVEPAIKGLDQLLPGAEPPVDGADADPRVAGDLVQADLEPALVEHLGGRRQDPLPVPLGVAPQRPHRADVGPGISHVLGHLEPPKKWRQPLRFVLP